MKPNFIRRRARSLGRSWYLVDVRTRPTNGGSGIHSRDEFTSEVEGLVKHNHFRHTWRPLRASIAHFVHSLHKWQPR